MSKWRKSPFHDELISIGDHRMHVTPFWSDAHHLRITLEHWLTFIPANNFANFAGWDNKCRWTTDFHILTPIETGKLTKNAIEKSWYRTYSDWSRTWGSKYYTNVLAKKRRINFISGFLSSSDRIIPNFSSQRDLYTTQSGSNNLCSLRITSLPK